MKHTLKTAVSLVLCLCLCLGMTLPAFAANENNSEGVVLTAALDKQELPVSSQPQTVTMTVNANKGMTVGSIGATITYDQALTLETANITNSDNRIDFTGKCSVTVGRESQQWEGTISWFPADSEDVTNVTNLAVVTFTIPANTPAGTYTVGMNNIELSREYGTIWENAATVSASLTLVDSENTTEGYTASLSTLSLTPTVDDTVLVSVNVNHHADAVFAAGELTLTYDLGKLEYDAANSVLPANATVTTSNGVLTLADYGADKFLGSVYTLAFTALTDGHARVTLTEAAFTDREGAETEDLIPAELGEALDLNILKKVFTVTLPEGMTGAATVTDGDDYTFSVSDHNYDYQDVTATINGESVDVIDNLDGTYTVEKVHGNLIIGHIRTPKVHNVTIDGETASNSGTHATYGTDYTFQLKPDQAAGLEEGWTYHVQQITIGGVNYTGYTVQDRAYTILGADITGDVEITIVKTMIAENQFAVTVEGNGAGDAGDYAETVGRGEDYTLHLLVESGYGYEVTATMGGQEVTVQVGENSNYTVENVQGTLVFTVEKFVITDGVSVTEYLTLNNTNMYLIRKKAVLNEGKVSTYDGQPMFWSDKHHAYCYLVIAPSLTDEEAKAKVGITTGAAVTLDHSMDVNQSGILDAADAQLVYNMYMSDYTEFTDTVTMYKFLLADTNLDGHLNVRDAVAIINNILGKA